MVNEQEQDSGRRPVNQGVRDVIPEPNKINASTPYDFNGKNLTPYGGLLLVITMLEKLGFQSLVEQTVTSKRIPHAMDLYHFVLGIVLGLYIGFPRLNQLRFIARDPILTGILKVARLPVQSTSTFWRFVNALYRNVARQILTIMGTMRQRVWEAANVKLAVVTIDTDTTVHTLQLRNVGAALPPGVNQIYGRSDSGFYCREAVEGYEQLHARFVTCSSQDGPFGRGTAPTRMEAIPQDRCRRGVRIPLSAGGVEQAIPVRGSAQGKAGAKNWKTRKSSNTSCSKPASANTGSS